MDKTDLMNQKLKGLVKDSFIYGFGEILYKVGSIILIPILSRIFLPSDYGIIDLLNLSYAFILITARLNIYTGLQKFYYANEGDDRKILVTSTLMVRFFISGIICIVFLFIAKELSLIAFNKPDYTIEIMLLAILLPIEDVFGGFTLLLRLKRRAIAFSTYSLVHIISLPILTYIFTAKYNMGLKGVFIPRILILLLLFVPLVLQLRNELSIKKINIQSVAELIRYTLPGLPANVINNIMNLIPRYILASHATLNDVGIFGMSDKVAKMINMYKDSFNRAWNPFAFSHIGKEDEKYLYEKVYKLFALSLLILMLTFTLFAKEIFIIMTAPAYYSAANFVGGLCLYYALRGLILIYSTGLYSANKVAHTSLLETIQLIAFLISAFILVPRYEITGLIISLDLAIGIYFFYYTMITKKYFVFKFSSFKLLIMIFLGIVGYFYQILLFKNHDLNIIDRQILVSKISLELLYIITGYFVIFSKSERITFKNNIRNIAISLF